MITKKQITYILIGSCVLAFGLFNFNEQNNITEGGSLGLGLLINHHFNISPSVTLLFLDLIAFGIGVKFFGKSFILKSLIATFSFAIFYGLFENIGYIVPSLVDWPLVASIFSGLFVGLGVGLVVRTGSAANGDDSIALILGKLTNIGIGKWYLIMDMAVILLSLSYLSPSYLIYSVIAVTISGFTIESVATYRDKQEYYEEKQAA